MEQSNQKSINIQLHSCDHVYIINLYNELRLNDNENCIFLDVINKVKSGMLTIMFKKTKSVNNKIAVEFAKKYLNGLLVKGYVFVMIPDSQIFDKIDFLSSMSKYIKNNYRTYFRNNQVNLTIIINQLIRIYECKNNFQYALDKNSYINHSSSKGWGCKFLNTIRKNIGKQTDFRSKVRYWYNYGHFDSDFNWIIDKNLIRELIFSEIKRNGYDLCPNLSLKKITDEINKLPDSIKPDGVKFEIEYSTEFKDNELKKIPINIRHISMDKKARMKYEKAKKIEELEYLIGMGKLQGEELFDAEKQLLVLRGAYKKYAYYFKMDLQPESGFRYSDN